MSTIYEANNLANANISRILASKATIMLTKHSQLEIHQSL